MRARDLFYSKDRPVSRAEEKAFAREALIYNVTEDILVLMEDMDVSKKELARRLGKSRSYISQVLSGSRNMTLGSLADICYVLGVVPRIVIDSERTVKLHPPIPSVQTDWASEARFERAERVTMTRSVLEVANDHDWVTEIRTAVS